MGTRHLIMVISKKQTKVAQYGQWDGYPSGQGKSILSFLQNADLKEFEKKVDNLRFMNDEDKKEYDAFLKSIGCENGWMTMEQSSKFQEKYFFLSRDCGSDILGLIMDKPVVKENYKGAGEYVNTVYNQPVSFLTDSSEFAADSLFCEWAYVIDLDKKTFEVFKGFNKKPLGKTQRFYYLQEQNKHHEEQRGNDQYYPVRLKKKYNLDALPTLEKFLDELEGKDEE